MEQISYQILREEGFIADFLQINEARLTFADYMGLDNYYRRQAARTSGLSVQTYKLVRGAMDLIFGFLPLEVKSWIDNALAKDSMYDLVLFSWHTIKRTTDKSSAFSLLSNVSWPTLTNGDRHFF